jgi:hypothetical protein
MRGKSTPKYNIFKPTNVFLAFLMVALIFFAPVVYPSSTDVGGEQNPLIQEFLPALNPFASSADACPWGCIKCTSWDPNAWPKTCLTYECVDAGGGITK